ncbi:hypothetical protein HBA54_04230 [Pelagibius litoralis]|uniref:Uncharacterized protein n=1 Tax=Pelagibius litoralis TaxID=374515 RepID=A0A967EX55_9PROT|nr:hypothetical protein [Pelagibius litoralis]NIA67790.1 hypothetical protein [Pelagibius litoralis]
MAVPRIFFALPLKIHQRCIYDNHQQRGGMARRKGRKGLKMTTKIPVLDDNTTDASVIGYAETPAQAARVFNAQRSQTPLDANDFSQRMADEVEVSHDPDINTWEEVEAVAKLGAWEPQL